VDDVSFLVLAEIVRGEKPERARGFVEHETGIPAGVDAVVPDHLQRAPGLAAIGRAFVDEIDVAGVVMSVFTPFAHGEEGAVSEAHDRGDAIGLISFLAGDEHIDLFDGGTRGENQTRGEDEEKESENFHDEGREIEERKEEGFRS
jgi:hypothetical protein